MSICPALAGEEPGRARRAIDAFDYSQALIFHDDFASGDFAKWRSTDLDDYGDTRADPDRIQIVDAPLLGAGRRAVRFAVPRAPGSFRSEIYLPHEPGFRERWYGARILVPRGWVPDPGASDDIVMQWHAIPGNWHNTYPNLAISIQDSSWLVRRSHGVAQNGPTRAVDRLEDPVRPGGWVSWVMHARWSPGADGLLEIWKDGSLVMHHSGPNVYSSLGVEYTPYFKIGLYHPAWKLDRDDKRRAFEREKPVATHKTIYATDVRIGDERAGVETVTPVP